MVGDCFRPDTGAVDYFRQLSFSNRHVTGRELAQCSRPSLLKRILMVVSMLFVNKCLRGHVYNPVPVPLISAQHGGNVVFAVWHQYRDS